MTVRVGLVQTRTPATHAAALAHVEPLIRQAAAEGAVLVMTPEGTNILQRDRSALLPVLTSPEADPVVQGLRDLAQRLKIELLIGSVLVKRALGGFANRSLFIGCDGLIKAQYDKIHMFDVDLQSGESVRESQTYSPGETAVTAPSAAGLLGLTICYDVRFPALYRALAQAGAEVFAAPSAFTRPTGEAHWEILLRARAIETGAFVLAAAQGGRHEDGRGTYGRSMAVGPWGQVLGKLDHDEPGVLTVDVDVQAVAAARHAIPSLRNERRFNPPSVQRAAAE
jgi:predicted amidohydrolase